MESSDLSKLHQPYTWAEISQNTWKLNCAWPLKLQSFSAAGPTCYRHTSASVEHLFLFGVLSTPIKSCNLHNILAKSTILMHINPKHGNSTIIYSQYTHTNESFYWSFCKNFQTFTSHWVIVHTFFKYMCEASIPSLKTMIFYILVTVLLKCWGLKP